MFVFYLGFVLSVIGLLFTTFRTFKTRNIISPQMFLFVGVLIFLYLPAVANNFSLSDTSFNATILIGIIGCFAASALFPYNILDRDEKKEREIPITIFKYGAIIYAIVLSYEIVHTIMEKGSILAVFLSNRLDSYLGDDIAENGSPIRALFFEGLKIFFYYYVNYLFCNGKKWRAIGLFIIPMIHHRFTAITRYDFLAMAGALLIFWLDQKLYTGRQQKEEGKKRINFLKVTIIAVVGVYFALLFMKTANLTRHGLGNEKFDISYSSLLLDEFSTDANYYEYLYELSKAVDDGTYNMEYGAAWYYYPFVNMIPRAIWHDKPYTSFSVRGTEGVYWSYDSGNPVVTFTLFGEGYAQFGLFGVFICPLIFLGCRFVNFRQARRMKYNKLYILIIMFSLLTYMRAEAPVFHMIIDGLWLWGIQKYLIRK